MFSLWAAVFLGTACTPACEGATCSNLYPAGLLGRFDLAQRTPERDPRLPDIAWQGIASDGNAWAFAAIGDRVALGLPDAGAVRVDGVVAFTGDASSHFGAAIDAGADAEGRAEIVVGWPGATGTLGQAHAGAVQGWQEGDDGAWGMVWELRGTVPEGRLGSSVARCADLDADGQPDVVVGARWSGGAGLDGAAVLLLSGDGPLLGGIPASQAHVRAGAAAGDQYGAALACTGDVTGDAQDDLVVGAPGAGGGAGAVQVIAGGPGVAERDPWATWTGEADEDWLGASVALADLDGDGVDDVVAGAPGADGVAGASDVTGAVFAWRGGAVAPTGPSLRVAGEAGRDRHGAALAVADLDGDGAVDLAVGAPGHNPTGDAGDQGSGAAYVHWGPLLGESAPRQAADAATRVEAARGYLDTGGRMGVVTATDGTRAELVLRVRMPAAATGP